MQPPWRSCWPWSLQAPLKLRPGVVLEVLEGREGGQGGQRGGRQEKLGQGGAHWESRWETATPRSVGTKNIPVSIPACSLLPRLGLAQLWSNEL